MNHEFKVGDRVRRIDIEPNEDFYHDNTGTVVAVNSSGLSIDVMVDWSGKVVRGNDPYAITKEE